MARSGRRLEFRIEGRWYYGKGRYHEHRASWVKSGGARAGGSAFKTNGEYLNDIGGEFIPVLRSPALLRGRIRPRRTPLLSNSR